jgi:hypothetical protein
MNNYLITKSKKSRAKEPLKPIHLNLYVIFFNYKN